MACLHGDLEMLKYVVGLKECQEFEGYIDFKIETHNMMTGMHIYDGFTPLMLSVYQGNLKFTEFLVEQGADTKV